MRFKHWPKTRYEATPRKASAAARAIQKQIDAAPLLYAAGLETAPSVADRLDHNARTWDSIEASQRAFRAQMWREARAMLFALSDNERAALRHFWNTSPYPGDPTYLCGVLRRWNAGELDLEVFEKAKQLGEAARVRIDAKRSNLS
ncbi:hypothetical protein [Oceanicaulis sp. MMSF_3324]|uniref:hypothetical protein n=1 Tax=Oceanicaulis sp. MMSF_3324 TaxID=3046702 RepID=UPI00273EF886|nr:hypothetical protein [Oceanicaulis sp. MMSF_3324]